LKGTRAETHEAEIGGAEGGTWLRTSNKI